MVHEMSRRVVLFAGLKPQFGIAFTREHIARLCKAGKFPLKIRLSHRCIGFYEDEIQAWLDERARASVVELLEAADDPPPPVSTETLEEAIARLHPDADPKAIRPIAELVRRNLDPMTLARDRRRRDPAAAPTPTR